MTSKNALTPLPRCSWVNLKNPLYVNYHDNEWGNPSFDDNHLFEMLILEGAQAGLSWETVLNKRNAYYEVFNHFDVDFMANLGKRDINRILKNPHIIRNRLKLESAVTNAKAYLDLKSRKGSFSRYLWSFVEQPPKITRLKDISDYPTETDESRKMAKSLKKEGFRFVGPTIMYAFMQAVGMVNDHTVDCYLNQD